MKSLEQWFHGYDQSHRHPSNIAIHKVAVPTILFATLGLLWQVSFGVLFVNLSTIASTFLGFFYLLLSFRLGVVMVFILAAMNFLHWRVNTSCGSLAVVWFGVLFLFAWGMQFYGHKVEGKRPQFLEDLSYLLIGPIWTVDKIISSISCIKTK